MADIRTYCSDGELSHLTQAPWLAANVAYPADDHDNDDDEEGLYRPAKRRHVLLATPVPDTPRVLAAPCLRSRPVPPPPRLHAFFSSTLHEGEVYGGACHACCHQIQLSHRLILAIDTRGRSHSLFLEISFRTAPPPAAVPAAAASRAVAAADPPFAPPPPAFVAAADGYVYYGYNGAGIGYHGETEAAVCPTASQSGSGRGGRPCSYADWCSAWEGMVAAGSDRVVASGWIGGNSAGPVSVDLPSCGVSLQLRALGRTASFTLSIRERPRLSTPFTRKSGAMCSCGLVLANDLTLGRGY